MVEHATLRVLVVDDELAIRRFLRTSLQAHGYTVFEAHTGEDAIQEVAAKRPDLVILDIGLPGLAGMAVTKAIRVRRYPDSLGAGSEAKKNCRLG